MLRTLFIFVFFPTLLFACDGEKPSVANSAGEAQQVATHAESAELDRLPNTLLGMYDKNPENCQKQMTTSRVVLEARKIRGYYGHADIKAISQSGNDYTIDATMYHTEGAVEVTPQAAKYQVSEQDNSITLYVLSVGDIEPKTLVRCSPKNTEKNVYTDLILGHCELLKEYEQRGGYEMRCPGYKDTPVFVSQSDHRFDVDVGQRDENWLTGQMPFNDIGNVIEWRLKDGVPIAAILRFNFETGTAPNEKFSHLAVFSIGKEDAPGCLIQWVKADAKPSQNEKARMVADEKADSFNCS